MKVAIDPDLCILCGVRERFGMDIAVYPGKCTDVGCFEKATGVCAVNAIELVQYE